MFLFSSCAFQDFLDGTAPSQRCDLPVNLRRRGCEEAFMERSETKVEVNTTIGGTQVSPQDISITLRPGRQQKSNMKWWISDLNRFPNCIFCDKLARLRFQSVCAVVCVCVSRFRGQYYSGCEAAGALSCGSVLPGWRVRIDAGKPWSCKCSCYCFSKRPGLHLLFFMSPCVNCWWISHLVSKLHALCAAVEDSRCGSVSSDDWVLLRSVAGFRLVRGQTCFSLHQCSSLQDRQPLQVTLKYRFHLQQPLDSIV